MRSGQDCWSIFQAATEIIEGIVSVTEVTKMSAEIISLQTEQDDRSHSTGLRLPKSTIVRIGDGSLADIN